METKSSRFRLIARRGRVIAIGLAIAGLSFGFTACGDDEQDQLNDAIDQAQEAAEDIDTEELQQQADEAQQQIESALDEVDTEALQQQAEDAQKEFEEQYGN